ncbi:TolC family protein [Flavobacterium cucumis]|uniref:Efflux transporter, outer membrane factor (OMF) lipoprotein, NodT family n=1 Tax=Flavobacterium cucumis TaxID=416016 RepID=A0A1M7ZXN9_9FLAO|nr:TolC family protein [Flavobacterium cucumis]SHO73626.1 efflux transporter, outer membrane factor (OMF) lipoprotein, NodT family [Flavobacterium cucumis]
MKRNNLLKAVVLGCSILILHSCGIPKVATQESNITLPTNYSEKVTQSDNSGKVRWKDFFEDKYLLSLIDSTLVNNKELNILMQKVNMAQNEIQARKGEYLPSVGLGAGADLDKVGKFTRNGSVEENLNIREDEKFPEPLTNYKFGLYSTWELDVWKKLRNSKKAAVMEYMASQEGKNYLVTNLVAEVANSYYELIALDAQLKNLEQNIEIQKNALEIVKLLKESARTTLLAVKRFEAEVQKNQSEIYNLKQEIVEVENKINFLVGRTPQPVLRDASNFMATTPKFVNVGLPSDLLENRPDIKQAQLELEAAKLNIKVAKANFYPQFGLKAGIGYEAFNPKYLLNSPESLLYSIVGDAIMPLVNRNAIKATYKTASAKQIQAVYEYEQTILRAYTEVINQMSKIENLENSFNLKNNQVEALNQSIDIANQLFQSARADYMEVLLTQRDALEAKTDLIETRKNQMLTVINLYKALGGGWN